MTIEITKKHQIYHPLKVAVITILAFGLIALYLRVRKGKDTEGAEIDLKEVSTTYGLVPVLALSINGNGSALEEDWAHSFNTFIGGTREAQVQFGRVDILTDDYAIEIDRIEKWKEGVGQSLQYAEETDRLPLLALFTDKEMEVEKIKYIDKFCQKRGIKLVILEQKN